MTHTPSLRWTILALLSTLSLYSLERVGSQPQPKALSSEERMKRDLTYLASDECEGRGLGTKGIDKAADYIAKEFKEAGLKPIGKDGTYFQPFTVGKNKVMVKNVIGVLEGAGPSADETIVIGAHYDHLGKRGQAIYYGANDNASGTTGVMELGRRFGAMKNRQGRRLVFIAFSAEEIGLLGSKHYCAEPTFPLDKTVFMVNMDGIGMLRGGKDNKGGNLAIVGTGSGKNLDHLVEKYNEEAGFNLEKKEGGGGPSDHASFFAKKISVFFFFTGFYPELHTPKDTVDLINFPGTKRVIDMIEKVTAELASEPNRREYTPTTKTFGAKGLPGASRLGISPDYKDGGKDGLKVASVAADGPAAAAGLKAGDLIVELVGQPIKNLDDYTRVRVGQKAGETINVVVRRDNKNVTLKVQLLANP